jgi:hypothetical protein
VDIKPHEAELTFSGMQFVLRSVCSTTSAESVSGNQGARSRHGRKRKCDGSNVATTCGTGGTKRNGSLIFHVKF